MDNGKIEDRRLEAISKLLTVCQGCQDQKELILILTEFRRSDDRMEFDEKYSNRVQERMKEDEFGLFEPYSNFNFLTQANMKDQFNRS